MLRSPLAAAVLFLAATGLAACHSAATSDDHEARDAHDRALVDQAQRRRPPPRPVTLEPVALADFSAPEIASRLPRALSARAAAHACRFAPAGGPGGAVFVAVGSVGVIKPHGSGELLAADSGSPPVAGLASRFAGAEHTLELAAARGGGTMLTVRDRYDQVVYRVTGAVRCGGSGPPPG